MNNKLSFLCLILILISALSACRGPEVKEASNNPLAISAPSTPATGDKYSIDITESEVKWYGSNAIISKGSHFGYANLSKSELLIDKAGKLVGGKIDVDMNTISDEKHQRENNLIRHLKSADFFETDKFPIAAFGVIMVTSAKGDTVNVTGLVNIKGITQTVTFPATIEVNDSIVRANGKLSIDRTQWDIRYKSRSFGLSMADDLISDEIRFEVKIVARK